MINDKIYRQEGGDHSTNVQRQTVTVHQGISYQDAKEIALDVFKANSMALSEKAAEVAMQRVEELVNKFLGELQARHPEGLKSMEEPGMQYALFEAQKGYVKTGDVDILQLEVDILVDRALRTERTLHQIVLDESLLIIPKLTAIQLDVLALIFCIKEGIKGIADLNTFSNALIKFLKPFSYGLSAAIPLYQHLKFTGCVSQHADKSNFQEDMLKHFPGFFCKGFTRTDFESTVGNPEDYATFLKPCFLNKQNLQINAKNREALKRKAIRLKLSNDKHLALESMFVNYQMTPQEVEIFLNRDNMLKKIMYVWNLSPLATMTLTSVGIAIAIAHLKQKTGIVCSLEDWIT